MAFKATFKHIGRTIDYTPASAVSAGDIIVLGGMVAIAHGNIAANALGALGIIGVYDIEKDNSDISIGAAIYWDDDGNPVDGTAGSGAVTTTSSGGNVWMGFAIAAAGASARHVRIFLVPAVAVTANHYGPLNNVITDPGASGAIPVTASGTVALVTAGAESRTLAAPTFVGQELLVYLKTDGGDATLTVATGVNQTGNTQAVFNDAGDTLRLAAIEVGANLRWRVMTNDGATLSTP